MDQLWNRTPDSESVFEFLRKVPRGGKTLNPATDNDLRASIERIFSANYEFFTRSYAEGLRIHGVESSWPNDVPLAIAKSTGAPAVGSRPAVPSGKPVMAYWIRGRTDKRALVISGVHGSEQSGIEVVEQLHRALSASGAVSPLFTTILIPELFPGSRAFDQEYRKAHPKVRGTNGDIKAGGRYVRINDQRRGEILVEPNRNYPLPGKSGDDARRSGLRMPGNEKQRLSGEHAVDYMLPETAGLVTLIERFRPERIASVHAHRKTQDRGNAQGIFVDPRGGVERKKAFVVRTLTPEGQRDDKLTLAMLNFARKQGGKDLNPQDDIHYSEEPGIHPVGTSLGDWAPVAEERVGGRPAATIITLEVQDYWPSTEDPAVAQRVGIYAQTLQSVFLESSP